MNWCNCATSFAECKRCGLKCYPTPDSIQKLKADLTREREAARVMREALEQIQSLAASEHEQGDSKALDNVLDLTCETFKALAKADEIRGNE